MTFSSRLKRSSDSSSLPAPINDVPNGPTDLEKTTTNGIVSDAHKPSVTSTTPLTGDTSGPVIVKNLNRYQTALIFITNEVGIGVLSLPSALHTLGLIPGLFTILLLGLLTTYTAYILIQFYRRYPQVMHIVDCCKVVGGKWGMWACGIAFVLNLALTCASALLTISIALNSMTNHAVCTIAFIAIPAVASWVLCLPRKFKFIADFGIPCTISVIAAVLIVMISLAIAGHPTNVTSPWTKEIILFGSPPFRDGLTACLNIAFAYAGNMAFISVMPEMANADRDFVPALLMLQGFAIPMYAIVSAFIYGYAGQHVTSPALGSAPRVPAKIAYGILLPCVLGTALVFGHTVTKYLFVEILRYLKWDDFSKNTRRSWSMWIGIGTVFWIVSFLLANAIPVFGSILSIIAAIFVSWYTFGIPSILWLHLNWKEQFVTKRKMALSVLNWTIIALTIFANVAGMWASIDQLLGIFKTSKDIHGSFTCADNSIF